MSISSINIKSSSSNAFKHNDRTLSPSYLLDDSVSKGVEINRTAEEAQEYYMQLRAEAFSNYTERTGQKVQTSEDKMRWSAVVNLNKEHTLEDVQNLADKLCEKYGWQEIQIAVHRDEGCKTKEGNVKYNLHAHIEFFMLDKQGIFRFKKRDFGIKKMQEMQTFVAQELGMQRGVDKRISKVERLEHREYKQHVRAIEGAVKDIRAELATVRDVANQYKLERDKLKQSGVATQQDYSNLKKQYEKLKEQAKAKDLTIQELTAYQKAFKYIATELQIPKTQDGKYEVSTVKEHIQELKNTRQELEILKERSYQIAIMSQKAIEIQREETNALKEQVSTLERENVSLRSNVCVLEAEKEELQEEVSKLREIMSKVSSFFSCKTSDLSDLIDRVTSFFYKKSPLSSSSDIEVLFPDQDVDAEDAERIQDLISNLQFRHTTSSI